MGEHVNEERSTDIAVIAFGGRFPGSNNLEEFWQNLCAGVESVSFFTEQELRATGVEEETLQHASYVRAGAILKNIARFDAAFFGFSAREAEIMDPQHRLLLECAWEVLESANYSKNITDCRVGVYVGSSPNTYLNNLRSNQEVIKAVGALQTRLGNDRDHLATTVSYKLDLKGPGLTIQTACSTSLVAVHLACQSLLSGECDLALAGGVSISIPQVVGYFYEEGGIMSPDGHCRPFDAQAQGAVGGSGVGVVVLKRLAEARTDRDTIHAVIKSSAINNDGALKIGYTAPGVDGQADVIADALALAGIDPDTVTYVETHGTATPLGDPIEIAALMRAFRTESQAVHTCAIGSVKGNIGHLDAAAGVAGLVKVILALKHKQIPPSLHFTNPNPHIDFACSPFYVNTTLASWNPHGIPRRAGVSSFGIGGTNAHVVLEEAPPPEISGPSRPYTLVTFSAKTRTALETMTQNLADYLRARPGTSIADVAYSLQSGRQVFHQRRMFVCTDTNDAQKALTLFSANRLLSSSQEHYDRPVVFMFPGQGAQYVNMGLGLYRSETIFRQYVDHCSEFLIPYLGLDLRSILYPSKEIEDEAAQALTQTALAQPAIFVISYALAQVWLDWNIKPVSLVGHSVGEYVAACLAGVFTLQDALVLVSTRGKLMQSMPEGVMIIVALAEDVLLPLLGPQCSLAAVNGPASCVVSGPRDQVDELITLLRAGEIDYQRLRTSHGFHSMSMDPILEPFAALVEQFTRQAPRTPYISNLTGTWITASEAVSSSYWAHHLRQTVRFASGLQEIMKSTDALLLEVGPAQTLTTLAHQQQAVDSKWTALASMRRPQEQVDDLEMLLTTAGRLWLEGKEVTWARIYAGENRCRIPLPTYPFERQHFWVDAKPGRTQSIEQTPSVGKRPHVADWLYIPTWKRTFAAPPIVPDVLRTNKQRWLICADTRGVGKRLATRLSALNQDVVVMTTSGQFARRDAHAYTIEPGQLGHYKKVCAELRQNGWLPRRVVHLWTLDISQEASHTEQEESLALAQNLGLQSLLFLAEALDEVNASQEIQLDIVSNTLYSVTGNEQLDLAQSLIIGGCKTIPQEYPHITCRNLDLELTQEHDQASVEQLICELLTSNAQGPVAFRGNYRWLQSFEPVHPPDLTNRLSRLRKHGVYLIPGGLGRIGLLIASYLTRTLQARVALLGRSAFPQTEEWNQWRAEHGDNDPISQKIQTLQSLKEGGAEILILHADVAHEAQMRQALQQIEIHLGTLHGVFYAAGNTDPDSFCSIPETGPATLEAHSRSKVHGLFIMHHLLQDYSLDFCLLFSSLSAIVGGIGTAAYASANAFMDAFAAGQNACCGTPWVSVNWDGWQLAQPLAGMGKFQRSSAELAMTPREGIEALQTVLALPFAPQIIVSTGDLEMRLARSRYRILGEIPISPEQAENQTKHVRPELKNMYVAASSEIELAIAEIWQDLLGIRNIGIEDDFFELGGHSLLATRVISHLRQIFPVSLPLNLLFTATTIAQLAENIEELLLSKIEQASEEEIELLARETSDYEKEVNR
jgi:acyl transferase domain-containing protein